jgi:large subunit ribosomal protein L6
MSRLGRKIIELPEGTKAEKQGDFVIVKGPKGELKTKINNIVDVNISPKEISVSVKNEDSKKEKSMWGLYRSLINNMVLGVNEEFEKKLEVNGVGYRVQLSGKKLILNVGFSHPFEYDIPEGINAEVEGNVITIKGIDKQQVGEVSAQIRKVRKPEPYKGKGIKYLDEIIRRKAGKAAAKSE